MAPKDAHVLILRASANITCHNRKELWRCNKGYWAWKREDYPGGSNLITQMLRSKGPFLAVLMRRRDDKRRLKEM